MSERGAFLLDLAPLVCLAIVAVLLEYRFPRKDKRLDGFRWMTSVTLTLSGFLVVQLLVPVSALVAAKVSEAAGAGLLNTIDLGTPVTFMAAFFLYDVMFYAVHRVLHEVPVLWRLHRTHHSDDVVDASTAILHHPLEFGVTAVVAVGWVALLGLPGIVIYLHYAISQVFAFWQHANIRPLPGQRSLSWLFVVPELHEVHHSVRPEHHNTNYGVIFSFWDRLFGTLIDDRSLDDTIECGLDKSYWDHPLTATSLFVDPFRRAGNRHSQSNPREEI
jgi:sterol desaturase/sphingolipid hydroxylase (fatty acid hydroxylase superfamily)